MGMPITVEITDQTGAQESISQVFNYFDYVDKKFSLYKQASEINKINRHEIDETDYTSDMKEVLRLSEDTKNKTSGYFNIKNRNGNLDPSGLVKGWAIYKAAEMLFKAGYKNFYVEAGGDIQASGKNNSGQDWRVGIRNPFNQEEIVKVVQISNMGMATSGTYIRGQHIYNPHNMANNITEITSLTVIGASVYEADRFATAAFAMGQQGINFIENMPGLEGYMMNVHGVATMTSGFKKYVV